MSVKSRKFLGMQFILDKKLQLRNLCVFEHRNTAAFLNDIVLMVLSRYDRASAAILRQIEEEIQDCPEDFNNTEEQVEESDIIFSPADGQEMLDLWKV